MRGLSNQSLNPPSSNPLTLNIPGTTASIRFSDFNELLDAKQLSSLLIEDLHQILLEVIQRGQGDRPVGADYETAAGSIHIHINDHTEGHGLTYGEVGNILAGIGELIKTPLQSRDSMFEYLDDGQPVTYGYLSV